MHVKEEQERLREERRRKMQERMVNYSHYVREMYYPRASEVKKKELEDLKSHIKSTIRGSRIQSQRQSQSEIQTIDHH